MRVIAGKARRLLLKTPEGLVTRPTSDRIKETLFNMLQDELAGACFLDLFSGSGGIGIEALSRGARHAYFVENNREALDCIRQNLHTTHMEDDATVMAMDVLEAVRRLKQNGVRFDIIFMDPPYGHMHEKMVLDALKGSALLKEDTLIIVEASLDTEFDYVEEMGYCVLKEKTYKTNKHMWLQMAEDKG